MQKENQQYNIQPADRLANVSEYYFSRKLKEVAKMNAEGKNVISLSMSFAKMPKNLMLTATSLQWEYPN